MPPTLDIKHGRSTLRFERDLRHSPDRVWRAVTDPAELVKWFPSAVVYEPHVGASMQFDFGGEHGLDVMPGEVLEWDPPTVFAFAWDKDILRFELAEAGGGTRLVFTHSFAHMPGKPARDSAGWAACFDAFDALLDGAEEPEMGDWASYEQEYAGRFGDLTLDGRTVRLHGPDREIDGRVTTAVVVGDEPGVMIVREKGAALEDGADVEIRSGTTEEPGELIAEGRLNDPLAGATATLP